ncbi:Cysteine-rich receptor-like protein kinase 25 [Glycine soja]
MIGKDYKESRCICYPALPLFVLLKNMGSFHFFLLLLTFFSLFVHTSPSPIIQAAIDQGTKAYYNCTRNSTFAAYSSYRSNVKTLLDFLSSNSTNNARFYNTTVSSKDTVYGSFLCRIDTTPKHCQECVTQAAKLISSLCKNATEAIVWYQVCYVRYSDRRFFSTVEESPKLSFMNDKDYVGNVGLFNNIVWDMMNDLRSEAASAANKSADKSVNIIDNEKVYGYAWCLPYLSKENCSWCLSDAIAEIPTGCCRGKSGGTIIYPSCGVRYESYQFHKAQIRGGSVTPPPLPSSPSPFASPGKRKQKTLTIIVIVVPIVVSLVLLSLGCCCFLHRKATKNQHDILKENFGNDSTTLETLRFELAKIEAATNRFAKENMIGKGGFGEVYRGILLDGQEIAVKRLTGSSRQGAVEFKNEVQVIAKLQHRNLVRLLGFCLEDDEKILIYEYVPNKSLDYFLLDAKKRRLLSWSERQKIIIGIARGILYLHEDSCLKIIHRDLKPSNVLLDSNMIPKISDFGMARIVAADQIEESTGRIVGTYGYMSPEYAMHGQFSVKSDVFSFGVMVLEIINGKRKGCSSESDGIDDIRRHAWTKWTEQTPLELLDPNIGGPYSREEVIKCIHIGLLCVQEDPNDRPTMATVVFYLNSPSINLPPPREPGYFKRDRIQGNKTTHKELDNISDSINGISLTNFFPLVLLLPKINKQIKLKSMASLKLVYIFTLLSFINFVTTKAQHGRGYSFPDCSSSITTPNSPYQLNLRRLLSYLSSNATSSRQFYNTTVTSRNHSDSTVYGMFWCGGDVPTQLCSECVANATKSIFSDPDSYPNCSLSTDARIWYDYCMIRFSNSSFFSTVDSGLISAGCDPFDVSNQTNWVSVLSKTINEAADEAANSTVKYATKEARISGGFQSLYCEAQCTPDLSPQDCRKCLNVAITYSQQSCQGFLDYYSLSCTIMCNSYPFYRPGTAPAPKGLVPALTNSSNVTDHSQDPAAYLSHNCSINKITTDITFLSNLKTLLSFLSSNSTVKTSFKTTVSTIGGLFMCLGDLSLTLCQLCVQDAIQRISSVCPYSKEAIIWYNHCLLRYNDTPSYSTLNTSSPSYRDFHTLNTTKPNQLQSFFTWTLANTLYKVQYETDDSTIKNYAKKEEKLNDHQTLYTLAQCTPDLVNHDCQDCLENIFKYEIPWCCMESPEGQVLYPSCFIKFGLSPFYTDASQDEARRPATVVPESITLEGLQFDLTTVKVATNNFSHENKIGKGGFGVVYKGTLCDGRQIAVKRLSTSSKQGSIEFENEILLIAKLQHKNLVTFIGFCSEEQEKILIYEYLPNGSLDYLLFGTRQQKLSWQERYKIIRGTASGILYLHEYSRLKVIHRDLKPSNILLDENMNPKLSDFGMAKIVEMDQDCGNTNRIAGTYLDLTFLYVIGYMSPEYAMFGQFSEKSDVFSFGVMILEIITGKKNVKFNELDNIEEGIIGYVWRRWKDQEPLSILDSHIKESYSQMEVLKCIHIGLLCVQEDPNIRPTMTTVISYLNNHSLELPSPQEPAFFWHRLRVNQGIAMPQESSSNQQFYNTTVAGRNHSDTVYGMFFCWGDVPPLTSIATASQTQPKKHTKCTNYLNHSCSSNKTFTPNSAYQSNLQTLLASLSSHATTAQFYNTTAGGGDVGETIYGSFMCRGDVTNHTCQECFKTATQQITLRCPHSKEALIWYHECLVRYSNRCFFSTVEEWPRFSFMDYNVTSSTKEEGSYGFWLLSKTLSDAVGEAANAGPAGTMKFATKNATLSGAQEVYTLVQCTPDLSSQDCIGRESVTLEGLQFELAIIKTATNNFSLENKIGKGGFGEVYKGILPCGRHIAVKRLSTSSQQGSVEFKNEILLIAKLQHKNLVELIDSQKHRQLTWPERFKIVKGIARGILYLHEDSRLKIIHRDIKPSNVLLDNGINPKISDFGMARMVATDQIQGCTNRVVGTYGYMSPEYAMHGQFSEKSDVFSFGVMVLEIISGKKNSCSFESCRVDDLLSYAWNNWRDESPYQLLDSTLLESYVPNEVEKCMQIGLLCVQENPDDRPTMGTIVSYLSNPSFEMPFPLEPAFFMHGRMRRHSAEHESSSEHMPKVKSTMAATIGITNVRFTSTRFRPEQTSLEFNDQPLTTQNQSTIHYLLELYLKGETSQPVRVNPAMAWNSSFKLIFLFVLVNFLSFATPKAQQVPTFLAQDCPSNGTTANSTFQINIRTLFSSLSSNATTNNVFYNSTVTGTNPSDTVYGLFMCRGDVPFQLCGQCVINATQKLSSDLQCSLSKQAVIWYDECMVRYSNRSFFSTVDTRPAISLLNTANISNQANFMRLMFDTMNETADEAAIGAKKYATKQANISGFQTLYCLVQCTPDLSTQGCRSCLSDAIGLLPWCCEGKQGGRILNPSCNVRYDLYPFYRTNVSAPPTDSSNSGGGSGISPGTIVAIVVPITVAVLLFIVGIWLLSKRAAKKRNSAQDPKNMSFHFLAETEISAVESLRFDFSTIEAATDKFSDANKLGEGGFGEVYKGLLPSGQEVAVKRLSKNSGQGGTEFKNEVEVVAKLQHKNLVRLLGFCLEGEEKILVYEFVANKSLDYILFDPEKQKSLDWTRRYKIVEGIARGIQYLHEDSRLKIIHRDLKASNVLLDGDMNPKISDFGMARIFGVDQTQANTNRIVGTYGYMSPEYAMHGEYSAKSDVYSFGVLILEIISGKRNSSFYETDVAEDLLSYAWKLWKDEAPLELMDQSLRESYTPNEVIRCIHIGLLCVQEDPIDRPTMASVVLMLDSYSVPNQPAFYINSRTEPNMPKGLKIDQSTTNSTSKSVNDMSIPKMPPCKYFAIPSILFFLLSFLIFPTKAAPIYSYHACTNSSKYQPNSTFQTNLNLLLSSLSSNATQGVHFYKTAVGSETPNAVKGLFLCRGDTLATVCHDCVNAAAEDLTRRCPVEKEAIIWYDVCMVRYSNQNYLNNIVPAVDMSDSKSVAGADLDRFNEVLAGLLNALATKAANSEDEKFETGEVNLTSSVTLYGLVQCTPELSLFDCNMCFRSAIASVPNCCDGKQGARVLLPGCNIRYQVYPFYNSTKILATPVVKSSPSGRSRVEVILTFVIPIVAAMVLFTFGICHVMRKQAKSLKQLWRKTSLVFNEHHEIKIVLEEEKTIGILQTLKRGTEMLNLKSSSSHLLLLFLFTLVTIASEAAAPIYSAHACTDDGPFYQPNTTYQTNLKLLLSSLVSNATLHQGFFLTNISLGNPDEVKGLFLCRGDVTPSVCHDCVAAAATNITDLCTNQTESVIWYDQCMLRYSNLSFLNNIVPGVNLNSEQNVSDSNNTGFINFLASTLNGLAQEAVNSLSGKKFATKEANFTSSMKVYTLAQCRPDLSTFDCNMCFTSAISNLGDGKRGKNSISIIVPIVVPIVVVIVLFIVGVCFLRKRASKKYNTFVQDSIVDDLTDVESLQFDLATIEAATNGFSDENKIGQGGFGVVYKGILPNRQEIAVKRLSVTSLQGAVEFRNEAALVAKLQHRNLVRLLGFCLEGREKILIYEYITNKSLDHFLFDPVKQRELDWSRRYNIIVGIARGILYLHEDSQLRIIHRDLKASNVLLDENMNPKISDFGMAKIFQADQTQVNTGRIVGTFGYMSPEYAMRGQFSVKSDVFSFGVLVLEIVSGKKNTDLYQSNQADDLLSYKKETIVSILDEGEMRIFKPSSTHLLLLSLFTLLLTFAIASEETPIYSAHVCTSGSYYQPNTTFQTNLNILLSSLVSNATLHDGFFRTTVSEVKGLFFCRGDVTPSLCQHCVTAAASNITIYCTNQTQSIIWYDQCTLRYSNNSNLDNTFPSVNLINVESVSDSDLTRFNNILASTVNDIKHEVMNSNSGKKFATKEVNFTSSMKLYTLAQCTPDMSTFDSDICLSMAISTLGDGKQGSRSLLPGCNIRYELYPFYNVSAVIIQPELTPPPPPPSSGKISISIIVAIVVPIVVAILLFVVGVYFLRKRASKKYNTFAQDSIVDDLIDVESLQFDLAMVEAATEGFSDENKIGQGGFGVVYKGVFPNGQEIAVKRLSVTSLQGAVEFRNEAALVAKLQHRNLVRLLGFCLEGQEKILIYEYIPNKSLDRFLFDPVKQRELDWSRRYKIIVGIARGIQYLHEDSQLRIIHRDLKASNVLLDENMNPKISDFGMAKIFRADQTQINTGRIVGTYGYMSPEYAMRGQFSVKSDVFSFGVLVLEIVSGKKNTEFYQSNHADDLLSHAWKNWTEQTPLELLDPTLRGSYSRNEVNRCIHIGLLCVQENPSDRPSMATIALMLNSYSVTMSMPRQPASLLRGRGPNRLNRGMDSDSSTSNQSTTCSIAWSVNEVSITDLYPR